MRTKPQPPAPNFASLSTKGLLSLRLCDLSVLREGVRQAQLAKCIKILEHDLQAAGLKYFQPKIYFGDEWFSPEGVAAIAVPFYLAHPRLTELEREMMTTVEGGSRAECLRLLRHEAGHAFDHAYKASRRREWRQIFGVRPHRYTPTRYQPDPRSTDYVNHLPDYYAQAHPDEDFAETFAVAITPGIPWRHTYRNCPGALGKLRFVTQLIKECSTKRPDPTPADEWCNAARMRMTLGRYYAKRRIAAAAEASRACQGLPPV